jgi:hypothetical protein
MDVKLSLSNAEHKELISYCNLNDLLVSSVVKESFTTGFNIERYGLLGDSPKEVIKEVEIIKEVPVEKVVTKIEYISDNTKVDELLLKIQQLEERKPELVEVKVVEYVDREVVREVPVEKIVTKIEYICDNTQTNELLLKIQQLEQREPEKVEVIKEVPIEIVKEVIVEKMVGDDSKQKMLEQTLQTLRSEVIQKDKKIKEMEETIESFQKFKDNVGAVYLRGSNLDEALYK